MKPNRRTKWSLGPLFSESERKNKKAIRKVTKKKKKMNGQKVKKMKSRGGGNKGCLKNSVKKYFSMM